MQKSSWKMRFVSPTKVVKFLTLLATIAILVFLYLRAEQQRLLKPSKQKHISRYYSINTTVIPHLPVKATVTTSKKDVTNLLSILNDNNVEDGLNFEDKQILNPDTLGFKANAFEADIDSRRNVMRQACRHHGLDRRGEDSLHQPNPWEYFIAEKNDIKLVWCNIFKSASSSWLYIFNQLAGFSQSALKTRKIPPVTLARKRYPRPSVRKLVSSLSSSNAIGFLIARNPYERFVSAYRDKIKGALTNSHHDKMGRKILVKYRHINPKRFRRHRRMIPTFKEFVRYVLDESYAGNELDMHWAPVYSFCNPCQVNLTHIIKFETFDRDTTALLEKARLSHLLPPNGKLMRQNMARGYQKTASVVDIHLNELTPELLNGLRNLYKIDFDLFGYDKKENFQFFET